MWEFSPSPLGMGGSYFTLRCIWVLTIKQKTPEISVESEMEQ